MIAALRAETRKLLTVRSTYVIVLISLAIVALFAGFGGGFRALPPDLQSPDLLSKEAGNAIVFVGLILAFAGLLLLAHEYRYNTIMYTLTNSPHRTRVLFAKIIVVSLFAAITSIIVCLFSPLCTIIGAHLHGYHIVAQHFDYWSILSKGVFVGWGYAMYAFILIAILRNQVGAIVVFLLIPLIGENILTAIFSHAGKYLPFTSLQSVILRGGGGRPTDLLSVSHSASLVLLYIFVGLLVSFALFVRRDAN